MGYHYILIMLHYGKMFITGRSLMHGNIVKSWNQLLSIKVAKSRVFEIISFYLTYIMHLTYSTLVMVLSLATHSHSTCQNTASLSSHFGLARQRCNS